MDQLCERIRPERSAHSGAPRSSLEPFCEAHQQFIHFGLPLFSFEILVISPGCGVADPFIPSLPSREFPKPSVSSRSKATRQSRPRLLPSLESPEPPPTLVRRLAQSPRTRRKARSRPTSSGRPDQE